MPSATWKSTPTVLLLAIMPLFVTSIGSAADNKDSSAEKSVDLTRAEAADLRACIYGKSIMIETIYPDEMVTPEGFFVLPRREVSVPRGVRELHESKRVATLKLLLDIAKGGRPRTLNSQR
jgi:hypothetical protein